MSKTSPFSSILSARQDNHATLERETTFASIDNQACGLSLMNRLMAILRRLFVKNCRQEVGLEVACAAQDSLFKLSVARSASCTIPEGCYAASDIAKVVMSMAEELRRPFAMYMAGCRYEEIAGDLAVSTTVARRRIKTVSRRLRSLLS